MDKRINIEAERRDFERTVLYLSIIDDEGMERNEAGDYIDEPAQAAWLAWQAARATPPATGETELPPLPEPPSFYPESLAGCYTGDQMEQYARNAIAADRHQRKEAARQEMPRDYFAWWTSIETDVRKSMLVFAHREPERLHALVRQAYEAGQQSLMAVAVAQEGEQLTNNKGESA